MKSWLKRLLWEEEVRPVEETRCREHGEPTGVSPPLRQATRFSLVGVVGTTLMAQVIGVRLVAPVDAHPSYVEQCLKGCAVSAAKCVKDCPPDKPHGPDKHTGSSASGGSGSGVHGGGSQACTVACAKDLASCVKACIK